MTRWDATSGELLGKQELGPLDSSTQTVFLSHGDALANVTQEHDFVLWSRATGQADTISDHAFKPYHPIVSPDSRYVAAARLPEGWSIWDVERRRLIACPLSEQMVVGFMPTGEAILARGDGDARLWKPGDAGAGSPLPGRLYPLPAAVSSDGRVIATVEPGSSKILYLSSRTLERMAESQGHPKGVISMSFSRDGMTLVSTGNDGQLKVWDVVTGGELLSFEGFSTPPHFPRFSPDGTDLAVVDYKSLLVWLWGPTRRVEPAEIDGRRAKHGAPTELRRVRQGS
jgi:WD40 repeat protein